MKRIIAIGLAALLTLTASAQKIGRVNFSELVQLMPEADAAREALAASQKEAEDTYATMVEEYQTKATQYQQKSASWTAAIRESKEKELYDIQNRIQEFQQSISQELQLQQNQLMAPLYQKAQETVQNLAKSAGLVMVLDSSSALYFDENATEDLTPKARKALNIPEGRTLEQLQQELAAQQQAGM